MRSNSADEAKRSCWPITRDLTDPWPINWATLTPSPSLSRSARCAFKSMGPPPSGFAKMVVRPIARSGSAWLRPAEASPGPECECVSMNPGVTYSPLASITSSADASSRFPISRILSPCMSTSACTQGLPDPSITRPFLISTVCSCADKGLVRAINVRSVIARRIIGPL